MKCQKCCVPLTRVRIVKMSLTLRHPQSDFCSTVFSLSLFLICSQSKVNVVRDTLASHWLLSDLVIIHCYSGLTPLSQHGRDSNQQPSKLQALSFQPRILTLQKSKKKLKYGRHETVPCFYQWSSRCGAN